MISGFTKLSSSVDGPANWLLSMTKEVSGVAITLEVAKLLVRLAGVGEFFGALLLLAGGVSQKFGAAVLSILLISFNILLHNPYFATPADFPETLVKFLSNLSMLGGAMFIGFSASTGNKATEKSNNKKSK